MPGEKFYDEKEAEEILRLAVNDSVLTGAMTRERLVATAAELGISEDAVARAERQIVLQREQVTQQQADEAEFAEYKAYHRRQVFSGVGEWAGTSVMLVGIDFITSHAITWSIWPVGMWGLVVLGGLVKAVMTPVTHGEGFERWKRKKAKKAEKEAS